MYVCMVLGYSWMGCNGADDDKKIGPIEYHFPPALGLDYGEPTGHLGLSGGLLGGLLALNMDYNINTGIPCLMIKIMI